MKAQQCSRLTVGVETWRELKKKKRKKKVELHSREHARETRVQKLFIRNSKNYSPPLSRPWDEGKFWPYEKRSRFRFAIFGLRANRKIFFPNIFLLFFSSPLYIAVFIFRFPPPPKKKKFGIATVDGVVINVACENYFVTLFPSMIRYLLRLAIRFDDVDMQ